MFGRIRSTTPSGLRGMAGVTVLDVREPAEWRAGHIDGSVHIPLAQLGQRLGELDPAVPLVAVCRSGQRSAQVTAALVRNGYDATNLRGGLKAWARAGLPLSGADGTPGSVI